MSSICLCMIVRDEAEVIERLLDSVKGLIDTWVICDTGSRDGTQELIRRALADLPGHCTRPSGGADYLLLSDADMVLSRARPHGRELGAIFGQMRRPIIPQIALRHGCTKK